MSISGIHHHRHHRHGLSQSISPQTTASPSANTSNGAGNSRDCIELAEHADIGARHFIGADRLTAADRSIRQYQSLTIQTAKPISPERLSRSVRPDG
jgi:hypothetical protein